MAAVDEKAKTLLCMLHITTRSRHRIVHDALQPGKEKIVRYIITSGERWQNGSGAAKDVVFVRTFVRWSSLGPKTSRD